MSRRVADLTLDSGHWHMPVADTIVCVDCGGTCHRMPLETPELGWAVGDVVAYRCRDCADMWYLELEEEDLDEAVSDGRGDRPAGDEWA